MQRTDTYGYTEVSIDSTTTERNGEYWADCRDPKRFASYLADRINTFRTACITSGRADLWRRALRMYYGLDADGGWTNSHLVTFGGAQGERVQLRANIYRSIVRTALVMTTGSRPAFTVRTIAYDASATETAKIGNAIVDKELDTGVEAQMIQCAQHAITMGEGWVFSTWDDVAGKVLGVDETGRIAHAGAPRVVTARPDEVIRDPNVARPEDHRWQMLARQRNRYELAAIYPEYRNEIIGAASDGGADWLWFQTGGGSMTSRTPANDRDNVMTYEFYHQRTDALPLGRSAILVGNCVIADDELPYLDLPGVPMMATREPLSTFGYADAYDMMALQNAADSVLTMIVSTKENFGFQKFFVPTNAGFTTLASSGSFDVIEGNVPPVALDFSSTGLDSSLHVLDAIRSMMQVIMGMNDVAMGDASKSQSGAALAQMQAIAQQFNSANQFAYVSVFEAVMTRILELYKTRASDEQVVQIAGRNNTYSVRSFKAEDLSALEGVRVEIGSAALRTLPMRHQIAQELAANPTQPITPEQFLSIVSTGRLEPVMSIARTNEALCERLVVEVQEGRPYEVQATMPHHLIIPRLGELIAQPGVDQQTQRLAMVTIEQHIIVWQQSAMTANGQTMLAAMNIPPPGGLGTLQAEQAAMAAAMMPPPEAEEPGEDEESEGAEMGESPEQMPAMVNPSAPEMPGGPQMPQMPAESTPIPPVM